MVESRSKTSVNLENSQLKNAVKTEVIVDARVDFLVENEKNKKSYNLTHKAPNTRRHNVRLQNFKNAFSKK